MQPLRSFTAAVLVLVLMFGSQPLYAMGSAIRISVDGQLLRLDVSPTVVSGRTLVPLRAIFEALGATVEWDESARRVTGKKGSRIIVLHIGSYTASVSNVSVLLDVAPQVINSRTMVPARFVAESLGAYVAWDAATSTVVITRPPTITSISLSETNMVVSLAGSATRLAAVIYPLAAPPYALKWQSSNPEVVALSPVMQTLSTGIMYRNYREIDIIPRGLGRALVSAATVDGTVVAASEVTVVEQVERITIIPHTLGLQSEGTTVGAGRHAAGASVAVSTTIPAGRHFVNWTYGATVVSTTPRFIFRMPDASLSLTANFQLEPVRSAIEPAFWYRGMRASFGTYRPVVSLTRNHNGQIISRQVFAPVADLLAVMGTEATIQGTRAGFQGLRATFQYAGRTVSVPIVERVHIHGDGYDFTANFEGLAYVQMAEFLWFTFPETLPHTWSNPDLVHYIYDVGVAIKLDPRIAHDHVEVYRQLNTIFSSIPLPEHRLLRSYQGFPDITPTEFAKIKTVTEEIVVGITDKYEKFKVLSAWVATHIYYDWDAFAARDWARVTGSNGQYSLPYAVLKHRVGVCSGYNALLMAMLYAMGIPARAVYAAAGSDYVLHVWTEAFISGRWVASDATWKSRNVFRDGEFQTGGSLRWEWFNFPIERAPGKPLYIRIGTVCVR